MLFRSNDDRVRGLVRKDLDGGFEFAQGPERWTCAWRRLCHGLRSGDEIGQDGGKVGRIGVFESVNECPSLRRKVPHRHDLMDVTLRDDSETTDFERRHEHAVRLVTRDFGRGIHTDFPPGFLDDIVQDKVLTGQLADETNKNRELTGKIFKSEQHTS